MRKLWASMAAVLFVTGVPSATGQQMQPYTSTDGRFTVQFPAGQIKQDTRDVALQGTDKVTVHEFWVEVDNGPAFVIYNVTYGDFPANYTNSAPQDFLASTRDSVLAGKTLVSDKAIDLNGIPGREFTVSDDQQNNYTMRQFLQGSRLYTAEVISPKGTAPTQASQFLNSLVLLVTGVPSATGQQMQPYTPTDGRFTVQFPAGQIEQNTSEVALQGTDKLTVHEFWVDKTNGPVFDATYDVRYADYSPNYLTGTPQDFLAAWCNSFAKGMTLVSNKAIDLNGTPGREFTGSDDQENYTVRAFLQGHRLYTLFVISPNGKTATQASQFLDSFKIQSF